jgi:hypothetical protein
VNKHIFRLLKPIVQRRAVGFLRDRGHEAKNRDALRRKLEKLSRCGVGRKLGVEPGADIGGLPLTGYGFYEPFFRSPRDGDFMYPIRDYVRALTSGTMGKPKTYLLPRTGLKENTDRTGPSLFMIGTYDGEESTLEADDVIYTNTPGGSYFSGHVKAAYGSGGPGFGVQVPPDADSMTFQQKVNYFIDHYKEIDIAYMTVTTLLDQVYPIVGEPFRLKAFFTQDLSAAPLKERIREATGGYPKTVFGSTESMMSNLPSLQYPGCFIFDWRVIYPEFVPEKMRVDTDVDVAEPPETLTLGQVEVGGRYQFIATPFFNDLTRFIMPDIFECVSKGDDVLNCETPVFKYYSRADRLLVLHNFTRISEEEMLQTLHDAEIPFVDFTARRELDGSREYMGLYIELSAEMTGEEAARRINERLLEEDKDWRDLTDYMGYDPLRVNLLPRGTIKRFLQSKEGVPRIARIGMRENQFKEFIAHATRE